MEFSADERVRVGRSQVFHSIEPVQIQYVVCTSPGCQNPLAHLAVMFLAVRLMVKKPRHEPSLHCKSGLTATSCLLTASAVAGDTPAPRGEGDDTAVPANSTPIAPWPDVALYVVVSFGSGRRG
jgi:hypothetical protein